MAVMQALQGNMPEASESSANAANGLPMYAEDNGSSVVGNNAEVYPTEATQVAVPPSSDTMVDTPKAVSPAKQTGDRAGFMQAVRGLLALLGISSLILAFLGGIGFRPRWPSGRQASQTAPVEDVQDVLPPDEIARKEQLSQRRAALGVSDSWLNLWVNQRFYEQYPNLRGRPLTSAVEDAPLRLRWDNLAMDALDMLELH